ncbi:hypothetical protein F2P81_017062 [Scophthalmus maximus]|uniref:Transposase Tc1-like domain-containing protein n=1 Tax=Scophthalmus maximus TaxID=52904 RepID=A0A6A4SGN8_SCOMX|nr:hypothetical protein F2P81_017062 [Scophthalmus maximus]
MLQIPAFDLDTNGRLAANALRHEAEPSPTSFMSHILQPLALLWLVLQHTGYVNFVLLLLSKHSADFSNQSVKKLSVNFVLLLLSKHSADFSNQSVKKLSAIQVRNATSKRNEPTAQTSDKHLVNPPSTANTSVPLIHPIHVWTAGGLESNSLCLRISDLDLTGTQSEGERESAGEESRGGGRKGAKEGRSVGLKLPVWQWMLLKCRRIAVRMRAKTHVRSGDWDLNPAILLLLHTLRLIKTSVEIFTRVHNIIKRFRESGEISARKRQGRTPTLSYGDLRSLRRHCIKNRHHSVKDITTWALEHLKPLSVSTVRRYIYKCKLKLYHAKRKPFINSTQKRRRLLWARAHLRWTDAKWKSVLWSDESTFQIVFGNHGRRDVSKKQ